MDLTRSQSSIIGAAVATAAKFARWGVAEAGLAPVHAVPGREKKTIQRIQGIEDFEGTVEAPSERISPKRSDIGKEYRRQI